MRFFAVAQTVAFLILAVPAMAQDRPRLEPSRDVAKAAT